MLLVGNTDQKSNIEPRLVSLFKRELASFCFSLVCQKKDLVLGRKFVCDFYIPEIKTIIEIDGGVYLSKGHTGKSRVTDCDRDLLIMLNPEVDRIIRITPDNISLPLVRVLKALFKKYNIQKLTN